MNLSTSAEPPGVLNDETLEANMQKLRQRLWDTLEEFANDEPETDADKQSERRFRLMMTLYPLDR